MKQPPVKFLAAVAELRRDPNRTTAEIAAAVGCGSLIVRAARQHLYDLGELAQLRQPPPRLKLDAAMVELRRDHRRSDAEIAAIAGASVATVLLARTELYASGAIPRRTGQRTAALRADPDLRTERPSVLARRYGLPESYICRVQQAAWREERTSCDT